MKWNAMTVLVFANLILWLSVLGGELMDRNADLKLRLGGGCIVALALIGFHTRGGVIRRDGERIELRSARGVDSPPGHA